MTWHLLLVAGWLALWWLIALRRSKGDRRRR